MLNIKDVLWAGTNAALDHAREVEAKLMAADMKAFFGGSDEKPAPFERSGNTAIISIRGPLLNTNSPIARFFGMSTYPFIRESLVEAAKAEDISQILLDIESGGGAVSGLADTGDLISRINAKVKPVTAFTDGMMASAAYWLGASAGKVFASRTAIVGSIGVITTHVSRKRQLEQDGIDATVLRAGQFKALGHPAEALTAEARAQIEDQLQGAYRVFVSHVAQARGVSYDKAHSTMADGREFFGEAAKTAGLVDGISTFDAVLSVLQSKK
jgi:signal peptide peptidase SppA